MRKNKIRAWHLHPFSTCIDAGIDSVVYNDIEDIDEPGYALYPSQGTIRNDLGAYGGNYAFGQLTYTPAHKKKFDLIVYPHPNVGKFWIRFSNGKPGNYQIQIINGPGQIVFEKKFYYG